MRLLLGQRGQKVLFDVGFVRFPGLVRNGDAGERAIGRGAKVHVAGPAEGARVSLAEFLDLQFSKIVDLLGGVLVHLARTQLVHTEHVEPEPAKGPVFFVFCF